MVYTEEAISGVSNELGYRYRIELNVPFELIPRAFIDALPEKEFTYEEFLAKASLMNELDMYWNMCVLDLERELAVLVVWGTIDPLEKIMHITRLAAHPDLMRERGMMRHDVGIKLLEAIKLFGQYLGMEHIIWISRQYKAWLRKLEGEVYLSDARVMEFY